MNPSLNHTEYREQTFNKVCTVNNGQVEFLHKGTRYQLTGDCLKNLNGMTVMVDSGFAVTRGGSQLGHLTSI